MKYFLDTEFLEGTQKEKFSISLFRKNTPNTIDLISIGIVAEDGREYYAISKDFNLKEAWNRFDLKHYSGDMRNRFPDGCKDYWIRENVLKPIWREFIVLETDYLVKQKSIIGYAKDLNMNFDLKNFKYLLNKYGKTNKEIAKEIRNFVYLENRDHGGQIIIGSFIPNKYPSPEFYANFADYDWVVFCWLFGKMNDLPKGFPQYCKDLKQIFDEKQAFISDVTRYNPKYIGSLKKHVSCPIQDPSKSHNAIEDARWNKEFFNFLDKTCPLL
jgi:hypothetical protein